MATADGRTRGRVRLSLILYVARRDLARRYAGSALGAVWALAYPLLQLGLYWAVAAYGFRLGGRSEPLGALLIAGMTPWFFLSDALGAMSRSFTGNVALLKRLVVPPPVMPLASLAAAWMVHICVLAIAFLALIALGHRPPPGLVLLPYFMVCATFFALTCGTLLALANAAVRDVSQVLGPMLLLWFWATPIVWPAQALPQRLQPLVVCNPLAYLVRGYRFALLGRPSDWPSLEATAAFWAVTIAMGLIAWWTFRRFGRDLGDLL